MKYLAILLLLLIGGCSQKQFPPVHALPSGTYAVPGCDRYDKINERHRIVIATAQEAELSGYRPMGSCRELAKIRIDEEIVAHGKMEPTAETQRVKADLLRHKDLEDKQEELIEKQKDLEDKQDEIKSDLNF